LSESDTTRQQAMNQTGITRRMFVKYFCTRVDRIRETARRDVDSDGVKIAAVVTTKSRC